MPDRLFAAFKPIPRDGGQGEDEDPYEPSELPTGATQEGAQENVAAV